jgi:hypothetical protein
MMDGIGIMRALSHEPMIDQGHGAGRRSQKDPERNQVCINTHSFKASVYGYIKSTKYCCNPRTRRPSQQQQEKRKSQADPSKEQKPKAEVSKTHAPISLAGHGAHNPKLDTHRHNHLAECVVFPFPSLKIVLGSHPIPAIL